jgi:hypothetical protein
MGWKIKLPYAIVVLLGLMFVAHEALEVGSQVYYIRELWKTGPSFSSVSTGAPHYSLPNPKEDVCTTGALPVPAPKGGPPEKIQVGQSVYQIMYAEHTWLSHCNALALTDLEHNYIVLDRTRGLQGVREDVLHELMHIALIENGGRKPRTYNNPDDDFIKPTAPALRDILIDNPSLVKWLLTPVQGAE